MNEDRPDTKAGWIVWALLGDDFPPSEQVIPMLLLYLHSFWIAGVLGPQAEQPLLALFFATSLALLTRLTIPRIARINQTTWHDREQQAKQMARMTIGTLFDHWEWDDEMMDARLKARQSKIDHQGNTHFLKVPKDTFEDDIARQKFKNEIRRSIRGELVFVEAEEWGFTADMTLSPDDIGDVDEPLTLDCPECGTATLDYSGEMAAGAVIEHQQTCCSDAEIRVDI